MVTATAGQAFPMHPPQDIPLLLDCFEPPQTSVPGLLEDWKASGVVIDEKKLCTKLQDAVTKFLEKKPEASDAVIHDKWLNKLTLDMQQIIGQIDEYMRQTLLEWIIKNIEQSLTTIRRKNEEEKTAEDEDVKLAKEPCYIVARCIVKNDPLSPFKPYTKARRRLFTSVARIGAKSLIRDMIRELKDHLETLEPTGDMTSLQEKVLKDRVWAKLKECDLSNNTALLEAAKENRLETMDILLRCESRLADHPPVLNSIITNDNYGAFKKIAEYKSDLIDIKILRRAIQEASSHNITAYLLQANQNLMDDGVIRLVVERADLELWNTVKRYCYDCFKNDTCAVLHDAVKHRRVDIVEYVVGIAPILATVLRRNHYALYYNSKDTGKADPREVEIDSKYEDLGDTKPFPYTKDEQRELENISLKIGDVCQMIRDIIVPVIIRLMEPIMIRTILRQSNVTANEICLPLSSFNAAAHDFILFVTRLVEKEEQQGKQSKKALTNGETTRTSNGEPVPTHSRQTYSPKVAQALKFEKVLRYADFPDLNSTFPCKPDDYRIDYTEVLDVLQWLKIKGVTEIVEVRVEDRLHVPHNDKAVGYCTKEFKVQTLDWRKLDLYLAELDPNVTLETLHLYSSGNMAVVRNWLSEHDPGGVVRINNLKNLYIHVVEDVLSDPRAREIETLLNTEFGQLKENLACKWDFEVQPARWRKPKVEEFAKDLKEIVEISFREIAPFVGKYEQEHHQRKNSELLGAASCRSKVCLVDSGVIVVENNAPENGQRKLHIGRQIVDGQSFVYDGFSESPWWYASVPHGTQMASLLCSIDPCCELYVAKVGDAIGPQVGSKNAPVTPERVAEAVEWAITKNVDVIVLCLVMTRTTDDDRLHRAFTRAFKENIVVICSTADTGRNWKDTWPAKFCTSKGESGCDNILGVGACDEAGNRLDETQDKGYPYQFKGKNIYVGPIPFVESEEQVTGSSVATAIAAGIASLTLSCCRLADNGAMIEGKGRFKTVIRKFKQMSRDLEEPRYVRLQEFVSGREKTSFTKSSNFSEALGREFGLSSLFSLKREE